MDAVNDTSRTKRISKARRNWREMNFIKKKYKDKVINIERLEKIITDYISSCIAPAYPSVKGLAKVIYKEVKK